MLTVAQLSVEVNAPTEKAETNLDHLNTKVEHSGGLFKGLPSLVGGAISSLVNFAGSAYLAFQGVQQLLGPVESWVSSAIDAARNQAQLNAVLKSTHDAVGMSADQINAMVQKLKDLNGIDDDVILQGENMLLTFTNIGSSVFPMASQAMLNMAVAMNHGSLQGLDLKDTAIQLGKALNDPINGITALTRVGVTFTEQQKEQIKAMVAAGDTAGAQKIILDELNREFGGLAQAAGDSDPFNKFKLAMGDMGKTIGGILLPPLTQLANWITPLAQQVQQNLVPAFQKAGDFFGQFGQQLQEVFKRLQGATSGMDFGGLYHQLRGLALSIEKEVLPILGQLIDWFYKDMIPAFQSVQPYVQNFANFLVNTLAPAFVTIAGYIQQTGITIAKLLIPVFEKVAPLVVRLGGWLLDMGQKALAFLVPKITEAYKEVSKFATELSTRLGPFIQHTAQGIQDFATVVGKIWNFLWPWMSSVLKFAWDSITGVLNIAWHAIQNIFKIGADLLSGNWGQLWTDVEGAVVDMWHTVTGFLGQLFGDLVNMAKNNPVFQTIKSYIWDPIYNAFATTINNLSGLWTAFLNWLTGHQPSGGGGGGGKPGGFDKNPPGGPPPSGHPRALGGPVFAGVAYPVGERGRELFVPNQSGTIIPHQQTEQMLSGHGDTFIFNGPTSDQLVKQFRAHQDRQKALAFVGRR